MHPTGVPGARGPLKVVLSRPSRCADIGDAVYYGRITFIARHGVRFFRPGELFQVHEPLCWTGAPRRV